MAGETRADRALAVLARAKEPLFTSEVASLTGMDQRAASQALNALLADGKIQRSKAGGGKAREGSKERRWRVKPPRCALSEGARR